MGTKHTIYLADANGVSTGQTQVIDTRNLADAVAEVLHRLDNQFASVVNAGLKIGVNTYAVDPQSRADMLQAWNNNTWPVQWPTMAGTLVSLTQAQFQAGGQIVIQFMIGMKANFATHTININALSTIAACDAYDVTTGWPSN